MRVGLAGRLMCIINYPDAKKECYDSAECVGRCIYVPNTDNMSQDSVYSKWALNYPSGDSLDVVGYCEEDNNPYKCSTEVKGGKIYNPIVCID